MSDETTTVRRSVDGPIGRIELARPDKLNALDRATLEGLTAAAEWFNAQPGVKVVVVGAEGPSFSAGFDLGDPSWRELGPPEHSGITGRAMADAIGSMSAVTIASIRGHCIGGGVVLASACDLRIASATTTFRIPEVDLGVPLYWTGIPRLVRELGPAMTKELVLTGRAFDAAEAKAMRLVNTVVADDDLDTATAALAAQLAAKPALVLRTTKVQVDTASPPVPPESEDVDAEVAGFAAAFSDPECLEAAVAYIERRRR
jgi:enoyl-CoA hydratase/carnithine racemase